MKLLVTATLVMAATFSTLSAAEDCGGCKKKDGCKKTELTTTSSSSEEGGCSGSGCKKK